MTSIRRSLRVEINNKGALVVGLTLVGDGPEVLCRKS